ncbi:hypothetical protein FACS1894152_3030 [Bacilli bacterium]|nr:hypothetical protein FACS1894152_3030 [Bacilli bacterium]
MMGIMILLTIAIVLYGILFSSFGFLSDSDRRKRNKAIGNFINKMSNDHSGQVEEVIMLRKEDISDRTNESKEQPMLTTGKRSKSKEDKNAFDAEAFAKSSEKFVMTVLEAFSEKKVEVLEKMLTRNLFEVIAEKISNLKKELFYRTVIVSFDEKNAKEKFQGKPEEFMIVELNLVMKQINFIEDENHSVVFGSRDKIQKVSEKWTFIQQRNNEEGWLLKAIDRC